MKKEHVPATEELTRIGADKFAHDRWMGNVENGEFGDALRLKQSSAPGNGGAPIVAGEKDFFLAEMISDSDDVGNELRQSIGGHSGGLAAKVVPALVRDDHAKAGGNEWRDLPVPPIPEFGEAMKKDDYGTARRPGNLCMKANVAVLNKESFHGLRSGAPV